MFRKQALALAQRETSNDQIVYQTFLQGARMYGTCSNSDQYAQHILHDNRYCNELLWTHTHTFFDLDSEQHLEQLGHTNEAAFIECFNAILVAAFQEHLGVHIAFNDIIWSCSTREEKMSYHIKVSSSQFYWDVKARKTDFKNFARLVDKACRNTPGMYYYRKNGEQLEQISIVDTAIYSPNRCMRSLGCSKPGTVPFRPIRGDITHGEILKHMLTISDLEGRQPFALKTKATEVCVRCVPVQTTLLQTLAARYGSTCVTTQGSLVILKNNGPRLCPIGGETNESDNAFMVLKDSAVFLGCHNDGCHGELLSIHEFPRQKKFVYYSDYLKLLKDNEITLPKVHDYMKSVISYVDAPSDPFFVISNKRALEEFQNRLSLRQVSSAKVLFRGYSDIHLATEDEPIKFSSVLAGLMRNRQLPTYTEQVWLPHLRENVPKLPRNKLNTFTGFALEQVPSSEVDFTKTHIYDLLLRLCGHKQDYIEYLTHFLAHKLQNPAKKLPICLAFIASREGVGKGSFSEFLKRLYCCADQTHCSFNTLETFCSNFNGVQSKAFWVVLEEVSAKLGGLKQFSGLLKDKISSTQLLLECKNKQRRTIPFFGNIIIFSNEFNILSVSRHDRRLVMFESDPSKSNNKEYFTQIYQELDDLQVMRAAFQFFRDFDLGDWNYRALPHSEVKDRLVSCCEKNVTKFHRVFMEGYGRLDSYEVTGEDIYESYRGYCDQYGIHKRSNRHHVVANIQLHCRWMRKVGKSFVFTEADRARFVESVS